MHIAVAIVVNVTPLIGMSQSHSPTSMEVKKRPRTAFTPEQIKRLENEFQKNKYLSVGKRMELSKGLKLTETQVDIDNNGIFDWV